MSVSMFVLGLVAVVIALSLVATGVVVAALLAIDSGKPMRVWRNDDDLFIAEKEDAA